MLGKRIINTATDAGAACTTDTVQILDGVPFQSIATYQFENNADDLTGNYDGTFTNPSYVTGKFGQAAEFNGSSSRITSGLTSGLTGSFSVSAWFTQDNISTDTAHRELISYVDTDGTTGWWIGKHNNTSQWRILGVTGVSIVTMTAQAGWNHIAVVKDSSTVYVYLNGLQVTSFTFPGYWNLGSGNTPQFNIGTQYNGTTEYWDGLIDQVRIYGKALSAANVATLYAETLATASTNPIFNVPSCVAYYKMSDATDETGSYDGTPTNVNFNVAGKFGNAGEFNGSSSKIDITATNTTPVDFSSKNFTISAWINGSGFTTDDRTIISKYSGSNNTTSSFFFDVRDNDQKLRVTEVNGTSALGLQSADAISENTWTHVCYVRTATTCEFFINGVSSGGSQSRTTNINAGGTTDISIGERQANKRFIGKIDQVRIFNKAITANEVETLYDEVQCIPTIVPTDYFEPVVYDGDGGTQSISSLDFQPDFTWIKNRDDVVDHKIFDSVRGATKVIESSTTDEEVTSSGSLTSFDSNGFTVSTNNSVNGSGDDIVAWNWKAGGAAGTYNIDGTGHATLGAAGLSITGVNGNSPTFTGCSINTEAGFGIYEIDPNHAASDQRTDFTHGLDSTPELVISKVLDGSGGNWHTFTNIIDGSTDRGKLNTTDAFTDDTLNGVSIATSTEIRIEEAFTGGTSKFLFYAFHSVDGYSKVGSFNQISGTTSVVTGFRPAFLMMKRTDSTGNWMMFDNKRGDADLELDANLPAQEVPTTGYTMEFQSNGFVLTVAAGTYNVDYIFMAFAEEVFVPDNFFNDDSTLATYKLDGDAGDDSGNGYNGTPSNITYAAGKFDKAAVFNNSSSEIIASNSILPSSGGFAISWWQKTTQADNSYSYTMDTSGGGAQTGIYIITHRVDVGLIIGFKGSSIFGSASIPYTSAERTQWTHFCFSWDGTTSANAFKIYKNDVATSFTSSVTNAGSTYPFKIGRSYTGTDYFGGLIDQVRIFDRALDAGEVTQLYNE